MIKGFRMPVDMPLAGYGKAKEGTYLCTDGEAVIRLEEVKEYSAAPHLCQLLLRGAVFTEGEWFPWEHEVDCLNSAPELEFEGEILDFILSHIAHCVSDYEVQTKEAESYGVYNGNTPIFTGIESFDKAHTVYYHTAKACNLLGLRCDLVNETTGEVVE